MSHAADRTLSNFLEFIGGHIPVCDKNRLRIGVLRLKFRQYYFQDCRVAAVRIQYQQISKTGMGDGTQDLIRHFHKGTSRRSNGSAEAHMMGRES